MAWPFRRWMNLPPWCWTCGLPSTGTRNCRPTSSACEGCRSGRGGTASGQYRFFDVRRGGVAAEADLLVNLYLPRNVKLALGGSIVGEWDGRVAERLMATGCKPVAPWSYGGSNPPPS